MDNLAIRAFAVTPQDYNHHLSKLFSSQLQEVDLPSLEVAGSIPDWLSGCFISNGPSQFEVGSTTLNHWFDGLAMLKKFEFKLGRVSFQNRFLHSQQYLKSKAAGRLYYNEFATTAWDSFPAHLLYLLKKTLFKSDHYDNCNVNLTKIGDHFVALTESPEINEFNPENLGTMGQFYWNDTLKGQVGLAHPHFDSVRKEMISVTLEIGLRNQYHIYKVIPNSQERQLMSTYVSDQPFYMHSFSITPQYVILLKSPLVLNKFKLIARYPFLETLSCSSQQSSTFVVIHRDTGKIIEIEADPFVCLHTANAYENGSHGLIIDLISYEKSNPYNNFYLSNSIKFPDSTLKRYLLDLRSKKCSHEKLCDQAVEFPRIHYSQVNGKAYQYLYAAAKKERSNPCFNAIQKIAVQTGQTTVWNQEGYYCGEPIFVAKPKQESEDDGILMFIALNESTQHSTLIILDARSMQQMAEISLPFHLPLGLHGQFFGKKH